MKARDLLLGVIAMLLAGCGPIATPLSWSCAPVAPIPHHGEEGLSVFGGGQVGQPSLLFDEDVKGRKITRSSYFYGRGQVGVSGQWELFRTNFSVWGAGGSGEYEVQPTDTSIRTVRDQFRAFHFQWDIGVAPRVGEKTRLEFGVGAGGGAQSGSRLEEGYDPGGWRVGNESAYHYPVITGALFAGLGYSLRPDQTIGFRWYLVGLGTGWVLSYRWRFLQAYLSTQPIPLMAMPAAPNWAVGLQGYLPLGED